MDFRLNTASSIFTTRELRRYRILYRSRDLQQAQINPKTAPNQKAKPQLNVVVFGSRGPISASFRSTIRKQLAPVKAYSQYKVTLFPTSLSQNFTSPSYLKERRSILKGSSFYREFNYNHPKNESDLEKVYSSIFANLNQFKEKTKGDTLLKPAIVFFPTTSGVSFPRRFSTAIKLRDQFNISTQEIARRQIAQITSPAVNLIQMVVHVVLIPLNYSIRIRRAKENNLYYTLNG